MEINLSNLLDLNKRCFKEKSGETFIGFYLRNGKMNEILYELYDEEIDNLRNNRLYTEDLSYLSTFEEISYEEFNLPLENLTKLIN